MVGDRHDRFFAQRFKALGIVEQHLPGGRQLYGFAGAVEEAIAILLLQLADLRADRGLRAEHLFTGAGKAALFRHFQKRDELIEVHCDDARIISDLAGVEREYTDSGSGAV